MKRKFIALLCGIATFIACNRVMAEPLPLPSPHVRLKSGPGELLAPNGNTYLLPIGTHILEEETFLTVEREMKRLQTQETRLKAENKSLKEDSGVGWGTLLIVGLTAVALGATSVYFAQ